MPAGRLVAPFAALAALAACDRDAAPASSPPAPAEAPPPAPYRGGPGPAYLAVDGDGLFRLDDGVLTRLVASTYAFHDVAAGPDRTGFAVGIEGLWKLGPGGAEELTADVPDLLELLAVGPDGVLWASDHLALYRYDGAWTEEPAATFAGPDPLIDDLAVDATGRVWVVKASALWRLDGERWSRVDGSFTGTDQPFFSAIAIHPDGTIYVSSLRGVFAFADGAWRRTALETPYGMIDELVVGPAGDVASSGAIGSIAVQRPDGAVRVSELADGPARARRGDVIAVDGAGRAWIRSDNGLVILDRAGALVQQWAPGTVPGLRGKVSAALVFDDGPSLPTLTAAVTGAITGRVLRAGRPMAGAAVELCDLPLLVFQGSPCDGSTQRFSATTDGRGRFTLARVPVGSYGFAVKAAGPWQLLLGAACCTALTPDQPYDVGALTLD